MFQIFIIFLILISLGWYYRYYTSEKRIVKNTKQYFIDSTTPYLRDNQLNILSKARTIKQYIIQSSIIILENKQVNQLYLTLLVGQLLKEIWKEQRIDLLKRYIFVLKQSSLPKQDVINSLKDHSELYMDDISEWNNGYNLIQTL
jgi:hypothetical protein